MPDTSFTAYPGARSWVSGLILANRLRGKDVGRLLFLINRNALFLLFEDTMRGTSLVVQWLGLSASTAGNVVPSLVRELRSQITCGAGEKIIMKTHGATMAGGQQPSGESSESQRSWAQSSDTVS